MKSNDIKINIINIICELNEIDVSHYDERFSPVEDMDSILLIQLIHKINSIYELSFGKNPEDVYALVNAEEISLWISKKIFQTV